MKGGVMVGPCEDCDHCCCCPECCEAVKEIEKWKELSMWLIGQVPDVDLKTAPSVCTELREIRAALGDLDKGKA